MNLQRGIFTVIALGLLVAVAYLSSVQLEIMLYKFALVSLAAILGYWIDVLLFPHYRATEYKEKLNKIENHEDTEGTPSEHRGLYTLVASIQIRRSIIVLAVIIGIAMGL